MKFAGFWRRWGAYLIDALPIWLILFLIYYFFLGFDNAIALRLAEPDNIEARITFLGLRNQIRDFSFLIWLVYCAIAEASSLQGTWGKRLLGIKVVDREGQRISTGRAFLRNATKILSFVPLGLGFLWVAFNKKKKGWHDILAKTYVLHQEIVQELGAEGSDETADPKSKAAA